MEVNAQLVIDILEYHRRNLYDAIHFSTKPRNMKLYSDGYIFNEDKSVKWNREQIKIKNAEYEAEQKRLVKEQDNIIQKICDDIADDIFNLYNDYDLGLTLPEIQLAINHAVNTKGIWEIDDIFSHVVAYLQILVDYKALNINTCKEVYVVRSAECDFGRQILGIFTDEDAAYECEAYWNENDCGSTSVECEPVADKFEGDDNWEGCKDEE